MALTLGSLLSGAGKILGGIVKASPIGGVISGAAEILRPKAPTGPTVLGNLPSVITGQKPTGGVMPAGSTSAPSLPQLPQIPGTAIVRTTGTAVGGVFSDVSGGSSSTAMAGHTGYGHYSRTGKWIRTTSRGKQIRSINAMNVRAAKRAVRRLEAGEKLLRKIFNVRHGKAPAKITPKRK